MADIKTVLRTHTSPGVYSALVRMRHALSGPPNVQPDLALNFDDLAVLGEPFAGALTSMYRGDPQLGNDGQVHQLSHTTTRIPMAEGLWLHGLCKDAKAQRTMEIGCAYGFSTLYFLAALKSNRGSLHIAIDPYEQGTSWKGIGARKVKAVGMESSFRLVEEISALAIPRLISEGLLFDLIFVD